MNENKNSNDAVFTLLVGLGAVISYTNSMNISNPS